MGKKGSQDGMSIMDAVDNLSNLAELDEISAKEAGVKSNLHRFTQLKAGEKEETLSTVKTSFKTIHKYLQKVVKQEEELSDAEMQRGVKAIMVIAEEAADKIKTCSALSDHSFKEGKLSEIKEFKDLETYYKNNIVSRFREAIESEEAWQEEWGASEQKAIFDIERLGLRDLETVKRDKEYELFYIRKEDGEPFFNRNLLRHIKLVSDFDEVVMEVEGDDPLTKMPMIIDRELQKAAADIRSHVDPYLASFYVDALKHIEIPLIAGVNKTVLALLLAGNPRNLQQHTSGKPCTKYYADFQLHLREVLDSADYLRLISHTLEETDQLSRSLIELVHALSFAFFTQDIESSEMITFIHGLIKEEERGEKEAIPFWNALLEGRDQIETLLRKYPSGPLFKAIDVFREREEKEGFDPIRQGNHPSYLYTFSSKSFDTKCLRIPSPTLHSQITKAQVIDEFRGFLRHLSSKKVGKKHLLINLQDRTSWEEHARCVALEELSREAEFSAHYVIVTLPTKTDFYAQSNEYQELDSSDEFTKLLIEQVKSGEECGFYFPQTLDKKEIHTFTENLVPLIHTHFFGKRKNLDRKERLDFIELFYSLFEFKLLDMTKPDTFSCTCKDGVDLGPAHTASLFSLLKLFGDEEKWSPSEQDLFISLILAPALTHRERVIDNGVLSRSLSALTALSEALSKDKLKVIKVLEPLYEFPLFQKLRPRI